MTTLLQGITAGNFLVFGRAGMDIYATPVGVGSAGGAGPITVETGGGGKIGGPANSSGQPAIGYSCDF